ncbi:MAG: hypothetical protein ACLTS6_04900 [Anaerobutyricum sp.]
MELEQERGCDGQINYVYHDMLSMFSIFIKFVESFANVGEIMSPETFKEL